MGRAQLSGETVPQPVPAPDSGTSTRQRAWLGPEWKLGYAFTLPLILVLVTLVAYPFGSGIILSFQNKTIGGQARWVGLDNYIELLTGDQYASVFWNTVRVSLVYTVVSVAVKLLFGLLMALMMNEPGITSGAGPKRSYTRPTIGPSSPMSRPPGSSVSPIVRVLMPSPCSR